MEATGRFSSLWRVVGRMATVASALLACSVVGAAPPQLKSLRGCGRACVPSAVLTLTAPSGGIFGLLENQSVLIGFAVTNTAPKELQGVVRVTINGESLPNSSGRIYISPKSTYQGTLQADHPADGTAIFVGEFRTPRTCVFAFTKGKRAAAKRTCTGNQLLATDSTQVMIFPDKDRDGLSDAIESTLLRTYAPLFLYAKDHDEQERKAPIDVIDFVRASKLVSEDAGIPSLTNLDLQTPGAILDPGPPNTYLGKITPNQQPGALPRRLFVSPRESAQGGSSWDEVLSKRNVGLYGHVVIVPASEVGDPALLAALSERFCSNYAGRPCDRSIYKVEYWQFYAYSHDYEVPFQFPGLQLLAQDLIDHGGDWCTIQLYIDPVEADPAKAIFAVYHYAHGLEFGFDLAQTLSNGALAKSTEYNPTTYDIIELQGPNFGLPVSLPIRGGQSTDAGRNAQNNALQLASADATRNFVHPVVYVEWGGHEFWPTSAWSLDFASKHGGNGYSYFAATPPNVGEIGNPMPAVDAAPLVVGFAGYWGYYGWQNQNKPPQGPPLHRQWLWLPGGAVPISVRPSDPPF
jgi:hypothetical protein